MKLNRNAAWRFISLVIACAFAIASVAVSVAQVETSTSTTSSKPTRQVTVQTATVVLVDGNDLIVKMPDGTLKHFANVPNSARVNVDGKQLGIHDLKPGMTITRTTITTTRQQLITTVQTVSGKVWQVNPPSSVILTLDDGTNQQFKIPDGQKFNVNGQTVDAWGLKKGMQISATRVVEVPQTTVSQKQVLSGTLPPPPPPDQPILVAVVEVPPPTPTPAPAPAEEPANLPKTGSVVPLIGLLGLICLGSSVGLRLLRM
jgi:hypothetical protein